MTSAAWLDTTRLQWRVDRIEKGWAARSRPGIVFLKLRQATIRARIAGVRRSDQPTVVLVCDPPNVIEHFDALIELIAPHCRVVCFEPPGFGFSSPRPGFNFTFEEYVSCIDALLAVLHEGPYLLAFPCIWSHIALQIAARTPDRIEKLMLWQSPSWEQQVNWAKFVDPQRLLLRPVFGQAIMALAPSKIGRTWYQMACAKGRSAEFMPTLKTALRNGCFCCLGSVWQQWFGAAAAPPSVLVTQPTLVSWGLADRTHRHSDRLSIASQIQHVTWHHFNDAGHSPELEASEQYAQLLLTWLNQGKSGKNEPADRMIESP